MMVTGEVDLRREIFTLRIRQAGETRQRWIDLKFAGNTAYGRLAGDAEWTEIDELSDLLVSDLFAQSGATPWTQLGLLEAAENIREVAPGQGDDLLFDKLLAGADASGLTRYVFDLNGLRYARYLRDQMEEFLRRKGELAGNMHLELARTYLEMQGGGELWVDASGRPVRQVLHIKLPPAQDALEWREVDITTDFTEWRVESAAALARLWTRPGLLFSQPNILLGISPTRLQQIGLPMAVAPLLLIPAWIAIRRRRSPHIYAGLVGSVLLAMVAGPLLQAHVLHAAGQRFSARHARALERQAEVQAQDAPFDPLLNPLPNPLPGEASTFKAPARHTMAAAQLQTATDVCDTAVDTDCDGVPNENDLYPNDPNEWGDNDGDGIANNADLDDDNDGLSDNLENVELGTNPYAADSDGDFISDHAEVTGFSLAGRHWYLDPLNPDSNGDGFSDTAECPQLVDIDAAGKLTTPAGSLCADLDGDTTPDLFDFDNDGDGVPDKADTSPGYAGALTTEAQSHFNLTLTGNQAGKPLLVEFDLRPDNPHHLWVAGNVLDWPDNDRAGQIRRIDNSTFLDMGFFTASPQAGNGDMMVQPMLELTMPYSADNITRGLPKKTGVNSVDSSVPLDDWLDKDLLGNYGVTVSGATSDTLRAYAPLHPINDPYAGDAPVGWSARMVYQPESANWGDAHSVRLLWMLTVLNDSCDTSAIPADGDRDAWCADESHWVTDQNVAQIYYDDFHLTGLSVTEEHGMNVAVIAQKHLAQGSYAGYLWHLSDALQQTFLKGLLKSAGGGRLDVSTIVDLFGANAGGHTVWGVPTSQLAVASDSAPGMSSGLNNLSNSLILQLLNDTYPTVTSSGMLTPTLLIARENSARTALLQDSATTTVSNTSITVDVGRSAIDTIASLQLAPYVYHGVGWKSENPVDYLDTLQRDLDGLITTAQLQTLFNASTVADEAFAKQGVISLAKNYFMALAYGVNALVAVDDSPAGATPYDAGAVTLAHGEEPVLEVAADILNLLFAAFIVQSYVGSDGDIVASTAAPVPVDANSIAVAVGAIDLGYADTTDAGIIKLSGALAKVLVKQLIKLLNNSGGSASESSAGASLFLDKLLSLKQKITSIDIGEKLQRLASSFKNWATILSAASVGIKALGAKEGWNTGTTYGIALGLDIVTGALRTLGALQTIGSQIGGSIADAVSETAGREAALVNDANIGYGIAFAVGTLVNWGLFLYTLGSEQISTHSLAFGPLLAETIARTILAIGELLLQIFLPGIGELIVAVVTSLDLLIADICKLAHVKPGSDVDTWVCGGISGAITEAIVKLIYDQYIVVDLTKKDRLGIAFQDIAPRQATGAPGFVAGNELQVTVLITNTIKRADASGLGGAEDLAHDIPAMFGNSAFTYTVESMDNKHTAALNPGDVTWTDISDMITVEGPGGEQTTTSAYDKLQAFFTVSGTGNMATVGLNQPSELFLNESWWIPALDCWGFILQGCARKDYKSYNPVDLGDDFVFDLFPATFDGFYTLAATSNASYRLAWDDRFPTLADADGDQLKSKATGGLDPDDGTADQDGDGLTDRYEISIGSDPANADSDADGLSDYWELFYHTRPLQPDSDFDGVPDGAEFFHSSALHAGVPDNGHWQGGWSYIYQYDSHNHPLATTVSADALAADSDGDGILDERERVYGFNPNVPSDLHVLTLNMSSASRVQPGAAVDYTASIHNDLRAMYADGLLQTEFPVDHLLSTRELGVINPQATISLTGQVAAPQVSASQSMSLTVRAGVVVDPGPGRALLLRMNDPAGSTLFRDASYNDHNAGCTNAGCPQANGSDTAFTGNSGLSVDTGGWQNFLNSSTDRSFTINLKLMGREDLGERVILDWDPFSIREESTTGLRVQMTTIHNESIRANFPFQWTRRWSNLTLSYDADTRNYLLYINGVQQGTHYLNGVQTSSQALVSQPDLNNHITLGHKTVTCNFGCTTPSFKWSGAVDQFEIYPRVLDALTIRALYGPKPSTLSANENTLDLRFDEPPGQDRFTDALGSAAQANCSWLAKSCPDSGIPGRDNQALRFDGAAGDDGNDGVGDYLQISADSTSLGLHNSSFTVMAWINPDSNLSGERAILGNDGGGDFESLMLSLENGRPRMAFGGANSTATASGALSAGQWHHVAFQYDKDARQQVIFVNGQQVGSAGGRNAYVGVHPILVGRARGGNYFDGLIDDLVIANRVLSASEIQAVMNRAPLVNLHLDEEQGALFRDESPSQHHAACQGDGCPAAGAKGQIREAPVFDGNDRLTITGDGALNLAANFSIALWVKPAGIKPHVQTLLQKHDGSASASNFNIWTLANSLRFKFDLHPSDTCTNNGVRHVSSNGALLEDQWNHIVVTFDGSTLNIYLNGSKDSSATFAATTACTTGNIVTIGDNFTGGIDEVSVYGALFSDNDVRTLFDYQSSWYDTTVQQLITVDADPPVVAIAQDGQYMPAGSTFLAIYATDATSPIKHLAVNTGSDMLPVSPSPHSSGVWMATFSPPGPGEYNIHATATDSVGHTTTANGVVYVDATPPTIALAADLNGATFGDTASVALNGLVSDPDQEGAAPSSGVVPNAVVVDLRDANGVSLNGAQHAIVTGNLWQAEFPLPDGAYGSYHVWASVSDGVGNVYSDTIGAILLDNVAPLASVVSAPNIITQTGAIISGAVADVVDAASVSARAVDASNAGGAVKSLQLRFRHASGSVWPQLDPSIIESVALYAPLDVNPFTDLTVNNRSFTTWGDGVVYLAEGRAGGAVLLDGASSLSIPHEETLDFGSASFSVAAWVFHEEQESFNSIVSKKDYFGSVPGWVLRLNGNHASFMVADGSSQLEIKSAEPVPVREWRHLIGVVDAENREIRLYLDGQLAARGDWSSSTHTNAPLQIGSWADPINPDFFVGKIDDVVIFNQALTTAAAALLAHAETWRPASLAGENLAATNWQYIVNDELEGPYKIDLLAEDAWGNRRYIPNAWSGEIDTLAPRLALGYNLSTDKRTVEVSCAAADYNLTPDGWACPVNDGSIAQHNKDAHWFTPFFGDVQKLAGLSTGVVVLTPGPGVSVTACDSFGHCATEAPVDSDGDGIPDHAEGEGDRDGDGVLDAHDYDPDGHFYELGTGKILPGGRIEVHGPQPVEIGRDGSSGYYEWTISAPGLYTIQITPPDGYKASPDCPPQPQPFLGAGDSPIFLGQSEVASTGVLVDGSCAANPYYSSFNIEPGEPYIYNNNIPFVRSTLLDLPERFFFPLILTMGEETASSNETQPVDNGVQGQAPVEERTAPTQSEPQHRMFLPNVAHNE
jgi:hypothetical protein